MSYQRRTHNSTATVDRRIGVLPLRWCAYIIDLSLLAGPGMLLGAFLVDRVIMRIREASLTGLQSGYELSFFIQTLLNGAAPLLAWALFQLLLGVAYFSLFEASKLRATPGKLFLGLQVVDREEDRIRFDQAFVRGVARAASTFPFVIGAGIAVKLHQGSANAQHVIGVLILSILASLILLMVHYVLAAFTRERQALHDVVAGTTVQIAGPMSYRETLARMACVAPFCLCAGLVLSYMTPNSRSSATPEASLVATSVAPLPPRGLKASDRAGLRGHLPVSPASQSGKPVKPRVSRSGRAAMFIQLELRTGMSLELVNRALGAPGILRLSRQVTRFNFPKVEASKQPPPSIFVDSADRVVGTMGVPTNLETPEQTRSTYETTIGSPAKPSLRGLYQIFQWNLPDGSSLRGSFFRGSLISKRASTRRSLVRSATPEPCEPVGTRPQQGCEDIFGDGGISPLMSRSCPIVKTRTTLKLCGTRGCQSIRKTTASCASDSRSCSLLQIEDVDVAECLAAQARGDITENSGV
jgi:uncharacterized RDD family membrane protein YckC